MTQLQCNGPACGGFYCGSYSCCGFITMFAMIGGMGAFLASVEEWIPRIEAAVTAQCYIQMYGKAQTLAYQDNGECARTELCTFQGNSSWTGTGYYCFYEGPSGGGYKYTCPCEVVEDDASDIGEAIWFIVTPTVTTSDADLPISTGDCVWVRDISKSNEDSIDDGDELHYDSTYPCFYTIGDSSTDGFYWLGYDAQETLDFLQTSVDLLNALVAGLSIGGVMFVCFTCCCCGCGCWYCAKSPDSQNVGSGQPMGQPIGQPMQPAGYGQPVGQPMQPAGYGQPVGQPVVTGTIVGQPQPSGYGMSYSNEGNEK